jgi:hypothetical protein
VSMSMRLQGEEGRVVRMGMLSPDLCSISVQSRTAHMFQFKVTRFTDVVDFRYLES